MYANQIIRFDFRRFSFHLEKEFVFILFLNFFLNKGNEPALLRANIRIFKYLDDIVPIIAYIIFFG